MSEGAVAESVLTEPTQAWRVYGIVPAETELPDLRAVDSQPPDLDPQTDVHEEAPDVAERELQLLRHGPIAAVVEAIDPSRAARRRDLLAHSAVLNALAIQGPVIPIAFGSAFPERDQVVDGLLATPGTAEALTERLEQLRGHAQFQIRVRYLMDDLLARIVAADSEISELRERTRDVPEADSYNDRVQLGELVSHAVDRRLSDDSEYLINALGAKAGDARVSSRSDSTPSLSLAFLVADPDRQQFEAVAEKAAEELRDLAVVELLGPLAPFDFVADLAPKT